MLPHLPASVKQAIEACWKDCPDLRPTAGQLVNMLRKIQESGTVEVA